MTCTKCGEKPEKSCGAFPKAVIEIDNPEKIVLLRKVMVPASMGDESTFPPTIGKYHNVLLEYETSGGIYLYSSDGIPTKLSSDVTELQAQLNALRVRIGEEEVARADADTALSNQITSLDNSLATVAKTGSYNDLSNKPTIGNGTLTIKKNGSNVGTFTANATANTNVNIVVPTKTSDLANDGSDGASQYVESNDLATVATSGSYNDLTNKPTIGNATLTIKRNDTNAGTFTANATTNKSINIAVPTKTSDLTNDGSDGTSTYVETRNLPTVGNATLTITENNTSVGTFTANATSNKTINITSPTKTSDLTNDGADGTSTYVEADDLPTVDTTYSSSSNNAIANSTVTNSLDRNVMTNLAVDSTPSTTTVNLNNTKTNLAYPSSSTTSSISLPVASSTQAGVMNSATFDAVTTNTNNINAILNGAVAISNLPASPTQAQLTTAWENETGLTSLINRASVYDVTNNKVWTYYTNDQTWHAASNTSQVTVNTFTNSSEGTIKGSTNDGQVFAESDGTGSVNGWDALTGNVANNTSKLATIEQGAEVNVQANWTQTNTSADDYIKNKPANLVQDANYVHTDNNFTTALKDKLNGISAGAEVNVQSDWSQTNTSADDYIKNKPANLVQDANYVHTDNNFTTTLKNKLDGIESGAEVNVQADWSQTDTTADDYIKNKPTIPTVNNATLTIQKNGTNVQTFTANSSTNKTANITVPTAVSELTNDSGYATTTQLNDGLATKQNTLTAGDNIQINGNTISATDTTYTAGNAIDITNGEISADIHPADFFTAEDTVSDCGRGLSLDDTMASTLRSVELRGDTFQQAYSGEQLLTKNGMATPLTDTVFWNQVATGVVSYAPLSDGWARVVQNSSGFGNIMVRNTGVEGFSTGTTYTVIFEIRKVSGAGTTFDEFKSYDIAQPTSANDPWEGSTLQIIEGARWRSGTNVYVPLQDAQTPQYAVFVGTTKSSSTGYSLRTFTRSTVPIGTTFEVRATVLSGNHSSDWRDYCGENWQPYVGGHASPSPEYPQGIQVVTGEQTVTVAEKNLFDKNTVVLYNGYFNAGGRISGSSLSDLTEGTDRFFYIPCEPNTTYSITKPLQSTTSYNRFRIGTLPVLNITNGTALNDFWYMSDGGTTTTHTITTGANANYLFVYFAKATTATNPGGEVQEVLDGLQIEKGSTATAYESYQGQSYKINLGKNIWSSSMEVGGISANGTSLNNDKRVRSTTKVVVRPGTTYTLSAIPRDSGKVINVAVQGWTSDDTFISQITGADWQTLPLTFTTPANCYKITLNGRYSDDTVFGTVGESTDAFQNIQLEVGANATEYAPPSGYIELYKIGDYQDYIYKSGDDWYLHKEVEAFDLSTGTYVATTGSIRGLTNAPNIKYAPNNQTIGSAVASEYSIRQGQGLGAAGVGWFAVDTNRVNFNTGSSTNPVGMLYYARETSADTKIENPVLVAQLNALAEAKSYNDQTNIIVTTAGENLPATLCVEAYRKSLSGVIEAIDSACTCHKNLVVYLPNGMTTYTNNDAPIPIPEVVEAFKRGQSVFLVDGVLYERIYTVTAVDMDDGIYSMRADQTGINPRGSDGHWHINGGGDVWDSVTFVNDATPSTYSPNIYEKTWFAFAESTPLLDQYRRTYYPASSDMTFNNGYGNLSVAGLWEKLASSAWNGNPVILEVPLQDISTRTTSLVDNGFSAESPYLTISVSLGPDNYFERETPEYTITGWAAEWTPLVYDRKGAYTVGIVRVVEDGNTTYSFVVSLTEVEDPID